MLSILSTVIKEIEDTLSNQEVESGGILGARLMQNVSNHIIEYYFDRGGIGGNHSYTPNTTQINSILLNDWFPRGIIMVGIVHSHVNGILVPSCGDLAYAERILKQLKYVNTFHLPIISFHRGFFEMQSFEISLTGKGLNCRLEQINIIPER